MAARGVIPPQATLLRPLQCKDPVTWLPREGPRHGASLRSPGGGHIGTSPRCLGFEAPALTVDTPGSEPRAWVLGSTGGLMWKRCGCSPSGCKRSGPPDPAPRRKLTRSALRVGLAGCHHQQSPLLPAHAGWGGACGGRRGLWPAPAHALQARGPRAVPAPTWAGLITTVLPAARQAAVFQDSIIRG